MRILYTFHQICLLTFFLFQPPKRKYVNYKELQKIRKKEKDDKSDKNDRKVCSSHVVQ